MASTPMSSRVLSAMLRRLPKWSAVSEAVARGARIATGGKRLPIGMNFFARTVVTDANSAMQLAQEETFGPVAALFRFQNEEEAIRLANATEAGLAGYVCTNDLSRAWRLAEALEFGIVGVNTGIVSTALAPFGGIKQSGLGREGSRYGLEEFMEKKYVCLGGISSAS